MVGRQRVRADVDHPAVGVEPEQAVAGPRPGVHLAGVLRRREGAVGDHLEQVVGGVHVRGFQQAALPADHAAGVPFDHRDDLVEVAHRNDLPADPAAGCVDRRLLATSPAPLPRRAAAAGSRRTRRSRTPGRRRRPSRRWSAGPGRHRPAVVLGRHPQQQVGEGQVGQQLPFGDHRCRWATAEPDSTECSASTSDRVDMVGGSRCHVGRAAGGRVAPAGDRRRPSGGDR